MICIKNNTLNKATKTNIKSLQKEIHLQLFEIENQYIIVRANFFGQMQILFERTDFETETTAQQQYNKILNTTY